jgi:hypothetical protein
MGTTGTTKTCFNHGEHGEHGEKTREIFERASGVGFVGRWQEARSAGVGANNHSPLFFADTPGEAKKAPVGWTRPKAAVQRSCILARSAVIFLRETKARARRSEGKSAIEETPSSFRA